MELVSGFLLWIAEVFGVKSIRKEKHQLKKAAKAIIFFIAGILAVMIFFVLSYF